MNKETKQEKIGLEDKQIRYKDYLKKQYDLAFDYAQNVNPDDVENITLSIFEKITMPYIYFEKENNKIDDKPTQKQIEYAHNLGIDNPENISKKDLSRLIDSKAKKF